MDHHYLSSSPTVATQLVQGGWQIIERAPKTSRGTRVVVLDAEANEELKQHLARQDAARSE